MQKLILFTLAFVFLWYGSGLIVDSIKSLASKIKIPPFAFSFFVLGFLTSIPEISVGLNAISEGRPEIFVGNLLGGVVVMFLLVIPLLAVINGAIPVKKHIDGKNLLVMLGIIATPALFALDQTITNVEGFILVALYVALFYIIKTRAGVIGRLERVLMREQKDLRHSTLLKLAAGILIVLASSRFIVDQTIAFSDELGLSAFIISLLVISIGTNLPEITLAIRSVTNKASDIAFGDFLGSASSNTLLFGVFTLINNGEVITEKQFALTFGIIAACLITFYVLVHGRNQLTRKEGFVLLACYALFVIYESVQLGF